MNPRDTIARLRALHTLATGGRWRAYTVGQSDVQTTGIEDSTGEHDEDCPEDCDGTTHEILVAECGADYHQGTYHDATLIAEMHEALPALLDLAEATIERAERNLALGFPSQAGRAIERLMGAPGSRDYTCRIHLDRLDGDHFEIWGAKDDSWSILDRVRGRRYFDLDGVPFTRETALAEVRRMRADRDAFANTNLPSASGSNTEKVP